MKKFLFYLCAIAMAFVFTGISGAAQFSYTDFSDLSALNLNGSAQKVNYGGQDVIRLTSSAAQAGSAFMNNSVPVAYGFSTTFQFQITNSYDGGADGIVFVVQNQGADALGPAGGYLAYQGITNSIGVEFDTWNNGLFSTLPDISDNHIGIDLDGSMDTVVSQDVSEATMDAGDIWNAWIDYDGTLLEVRLTRDATRPDDPFLSYSLDLASYIGGAYAYVGFTSGTGGVSRSDHDIRSWDFESNSGPDPVPEPATMLLLGSGLIGLVGARRKFKK